MRSRLASAFRAALLMALAAVPVACDRTLTDAPRPAISTADTTLEVGEAAQLSARGFQADPAWTSSDTAVAKVLSTGYVTAMGPGTAMVTAAGRGRTAAAAVHVRLPPTIAPSASAVAFAAYTGGSDAAAQSVAVANAGGSPLTGLAVETAYAAGGPADWLSVSLSATAAPAVLVLQPQTGHLAAGTYRATVRLASPLPRVAEARVAVTFSVGPAPVVSVSPAAAAFAATLGGGDPPAQALAVGNAAGGTLAGPTAAVSYGANEPTGWLAAVPRDGAAPTVEIAVRVAGLPVGVYTAGVDVGSSLPGVAARRVPVVLAVATPPSVVLSEATVAFGAAPGGADPAAQAVAVTNGGGGSLGGLSAAAAYAPGGPSGWLAVALGGTPASSTLTLRARTGSLPEGEHMARVTVAASAAGVPPAVLLVTFGVHAAPAVLLQPADVSFEATENGDDPAPAAVGVANGGGGSLTGLSAAVAYGTGAGGWLGATLGGGGTAPATLTLTPRTGTLAAGTRAATVTVASSVPGVPAASVSVRFTVGPTPVIHLSSTAAAFTASVGGGDPPAQTFSVTEPLNAPLPGLAVAPVEYASGGPAGWLTARLADAPRVLTLEARTAGLGEGAYTASVVVRSPQRGVQGARMAVTLRVGSAPVIRLSANTASFPAAAAPRNVVVLGLADGSPAAGLATTVDYGGGEKGWLVASADSAAKQVRLQVSAGSLPRATAPHRATVAVTGRPGTVPDTVVVTYAVPVSFAASVLPRFKASCEVCHTTGFAAGNLDLSAAAAFRDLLTGHSTHAGNRRVTPFDPGADSTVNLLLCVLDSPCTRSRDHSKGVPAGLRDTLELWIREGAPDN